MPIAPDIERELIHTRKIEIFAYRRADGCYDIDGHLFDQKPFDYEMPDKTLPAEGGIHDMWLRMTIDPDGTVVGARAQMDVGPHFTCEGVTPNYERLTGLTLGRGWNRAVRERLGGIAGCTHLTEMLAQMATTALQALWAEEEEQTRANGETLALDPRVLNACHTYREDGVFVKEYFSDYYKEPSPRSERPER